MASYNESITIEQGNEALFVCEGLKISHSWRSVDPCIFLEIGRLRKETLTRLKHSKPKSTLMGQITCMTESDWRVEKPRSIQFGSGFSDRRIDRLLKSIIGTRIISIKLLGRLPEITIELDDGRVLSTFTNWSNQPQWLIGFHDIRLFKLKSLPRETDISPWMHVRRGRLEIEYCYDNANLAARKFFKKFRTFNVDI
jgi:hypothetical protein